MGLSDSRYKDIFISQDELESLIAEAQSAPSLPDDTSETPVITQDDIDALLGSSKDQIEKTGSANDLVTQDDIDALLGSGKGQPEKTDNAGDLVTQDDIDSLFSGKSALSAKNNKSASAADTDEDDADANLDLVSPEDIRKLLMEDDFDSDPLEDSQAIRDSDEFDSISDDDIRALVSEIDTEDKNKLSEDSEKIITQDDIDALLSGIVKENDESEHDFSSAMGADEADDQVTSEDIDNILSEVEDKTENKTDAEAINEDNLISQDDIDKLLMGKYQEPEEETTLIDQEDIDRLLKSAKPFGDEELTRKKEPEKLISQEDIDRLLQEDEREKVKAEDEYQDQVILEKLDMEKTKPSKKAKAKKQFSKKKLLIAIGAASVFIVTGSAAFFLYKNRAAVIPSEKPIASSITEIVSSDNDTVSVTAHTSKVSIKLDDFVAIAPPDVKGISYISLSLTFEIEDVNENPVKGFVPFFRNIVYEAINKGLASHGKTPVNEENLKALIIDMLNRVLVKGSVTALEFTGYETG